MAKAAAARRARPKFLGQTPSPWAPSTDWADFLEVECLRQSDRNASSGDLLAALSRIDDDAPEERAFTDSQSETLVAETFAELSERARHSGTGTHCYPFRIDEEGQLIELVNRPGQQELYLYLLLATRMNMSESRIQDGIDGALLFEEICCEVAKAYWGDRAEAMVFGTGRRNDENETASFSSAVDSLCAKLKEGISFQSHSGHLPTAKDGKLDIVVWKSFADKRHGRLIGFGQCKTGTNWQSGVFQLNVEAFWGKWICRRPGVFPVRLFFMTARPTDTAWFDLCVDAGIVFDRCRMLDFAPNMPELELQLRKWVDASFVDAGMPPL